MRVFLILIGIIVVIAAMRDFVLPPDDVNAPAPTIAADAAAKAEIKPKPKRKIAPISPSFDATTTSVLEDDDSAGRNSQQVCFEMPTRGVEKREAKTIRTWTDANGAVHFADTAPPAINSSELELAVPQGNKYFNVSVTYKGLRAVPYLKDRLRVQVRKMYQRLESMVGVSRLRQVSLDIRVYEDKASYTAYANEVVPSLGETSGFFSAKSNEAVTYRHNNDGRTMAVARHESMHVIVAGLFGDVPVWLNEGLAEYFEQLSLQGQQATVQPNRKAFKLARQAINSGYPPSFQEFMFLSPEQWYSTNRDIHYGLAWAVVYFLMSSDKGRTAISSYLGELSDKRCEFVSKLDWLNRAYTGGFSAFERDLKFWFVAGKTPAHSF